MNINKLIVEPISSKDKRLKATFYIEGKKRPLIRKFGTASGFTYFDGASEKTKLNYLKRHHKRENWGDITTKGALSAWILWYKRNIKEIEEKIKDRFNINHVNIKINKK